MKKTLRALQNIFITKTPMYVFLYVTSFCNARCKMCFNWRRIEKANQKEELGLDEIKKIFNGFTGIQQLTVSGGEPFLREDLPEILEFISHRNDAQAITIPTNGILSDKIFEHTKDILNKIKNDTHLRIALSVLGIEKKHDDIMQVEGAFKKVQDTYHKLYPLLNFHKNLNIDIVICCSSFNKKDLKELIKYCDEYFKDCVTRVCFVRGDTRDECAKKVTCKEYQEISDYLYRRRRPQKTNRPFAKIIDTLTKILDNQVAQTMETKKMPSRCYAYSKMIVLQQNGDVFPCEYLDKKLGNLREYNYDIKKILNEGNNKKVEDFIKNGSCYCTWECALINNLVCNPKTYPRVFKELIKNTLWKSI